MDFRDHLQQREQLASEPRNDGRERSGSRKSIILNRVIILLLPRVQTDVKDMSPSVATIRLNK